MSKNKSNAQKVENQVEESIETVVTEPKKSYDVKALFDQYKTKSAVIRFLNGEGLKTAEIHKVLADAGVMNNAGTEKIRYQHVRNVLKTPVKNTMVPSSDSKVAPTTEASISEVE